MSFNGLLKRAFTHRVPKDQSSSSTSEATSSYYGAGTDDDSSSDSSGSFYGNNSSDLNTPKHSNSHKDKLHPNLLFGLTWWELLIVFIELVLVTYTIIVFLGLAKVF